MTFDITCSSSPAAGPCSPPWIRDRHPVQHKADGPRRISRLPPPSPGARSRCSQTTRSSGCTGSPAACPAHSITSPRPRSSPPQPRDKISSMTPAPRKPSSPGIGRPCPAEPPGTPGRPRPGGAGLSLMNPQHEPGNRRLGPTVRSPSRAPPHHRRIPQPRPADHHQDLPERERRLICNSGAAIPDPRPPDLSNHIASAGSAMRWLNSSRAFRLCDRLASSTSTGSISPAAKRL